MNLAHLLEAGMLVCFGFSWPINVVKAYKAGTAKSTSLAFIFLIITGYVLGIGAKLINGQFNYVLAVYILNLVIVFTNVLVYFRNRALDKKRDSESVGQNQEKKNPVVYAHEEQILFNDSLDEKSTYNVALLGGTYAKDIPCEKLASDFDLDFDIINRSTFALSLKNAKEYFEKYVMDLESDGIILQLGKEDRDIFKSNPSLFDTMYLELLSAIKSHNKDCRLALVSINNPKSNATVTDMNNHINAIAQSQQATFVNLENARLWNPKSVKSSVDFAKSMGLNVKKPLLDVAQILYGYAAQNIGEDDLTMDMAV